MDRKCNAQTGLCDVQADPFTQFGTSCSGADASSLCGDGVCLTFSGSQVPREICTESCTLGSSCAQGAGACIEPRFDQYATGDIGYCAQACNCDGDCLYQGDRCYAWKNRNFALIFGRPGYCQPARAESSLTDCSSGGVSFE
jgi:hypothetical protein